MTTEESPRRYTLNAVCEYCGKRTGGIVANSPEKIEELKVFFEDNSITAVCEVCYQTNVEKENPF